MTGDNNFILRKGQRLTARDAQLFLYDIDASRHFGYRMLHLDTCVHFHEIKPLFRIDKKLDCPCIGIADMFSRPDGDVPHGFAGLLRNKCGWTFFQHFLMIALQGTITLAQMDDISERIT